MVLGTPRGVAIMVLVVMLLVLSELSINAEAATGSDATTVEIAPGVRMPFVSDGIILDAGRWSRNHTGEVKGLDLFFELGGRGVDTAWSCKYSIISAGPAPVSALHAVAPRSLNRRLVFPCC